MDDLQEEYNDHPLKIVWDSQRARHPSFAVPYKSAEIPFNEHPPSRGFLECGLLLPKSGYSPFYRRGSVEPSNWGQKGKAVTNYSLDADSEV